MGGGWQALQQSLWVGLGFWGDRYSVGCWSIHKSLLDALKQSGFLGPIPFVRALLWVWTAILRFYYTKLAGEVAKHPSRERQSRLAFPAALPGRVLR